MNIEHYTLVFCVADCGYKAWWFPAMGLVFIFLGIFAIPVLNQFSWRPWSPAALGAFQVFWVGFAIFWTILSFVMTFGDYWAARAALKDGTAQYVAGPVEHFVPMTPHKHGVESFDVQGVPFGYSDYIISAGFNHTAYLDGPMHEGLLVHIWYRDTGRGNGNEILKLEIAGN
jgi:hypothetical protein